jgi:hypothetical protein
VDEYERLKEDAYDDSPWTREELQALAWEAGKQDGCALVFSSMFTPSPHPNDGFLKRRQAPPSTTAP